MKICTKCGAEAFDNAMLCPECGGFLSSAKKPQTEQQMKPNEQKQSEVKMIPQTAQPTVVNQTQNIESAPNIQKTSTVVQQPVQQQPLNNPQQPQYTQQVSSDPQQTPISRKFCSKCGSEVLNNASVCLKCGCLVGNTSVNPQPAQRYQQPQYAQQPQSYSQSQQPQYAHQTPSYQQQQMQYTQQSQGYSQSQQPQYAQKVPSNPQQQQYNQQFANIQQPGYQAYGYAKKESSAPSVLNFICSILVAASACFWLIGIIDSGFDYYGWFYFGDQIIVGFVCALAAFVIGITALIVSLAKKAKKDYVIFAITHIVTGAALALSAMILGIF